MNVRRTTPLHRNRRVYRMKPEDLHPGASVMSADGHKLGSLSRIVINKVGR